MCGGVWWLSVEIGFAARTSRAFDLRYPVLTARKYRTDGFTLLRAQCVHVGPMVGPHRLRRTVPTRSRDLARLARKLARLLIVKLEVKRPGETGKRLQTALDPEMSNSPLQVLQDARALLRVLESGPR